MSRAGTGTAELLRSRPGAALGATAVATLGLATTVCVVGLYPLLLASRSVVTQHLSAATGARYDRDEDPRVSRRWALLVLALGWLGVGTAVLVGLALGELIAPTGEELLALSLPQGLAVAATVACVTSVFSGVVFVPMVLLDPARPGGIGAALAISADLAHSHGAWPLVGRGLALAGLITAVVALALLVSPVLALLLGLLPWLASATFVAEYARRRDSVVAAPAGDVRLPAGARGLGVAAAALALVALGAMGLAAVRPLPLTPLVDASRRRGVTLRDARDPGLPYRVPDSEVVLSAEAAGVRVEGPGGAGAGFIAAPHLGRAERVRHHALVNGGHRLVLLSGARRAELLLDAGGVRLDDGPGRRLSRRAGWPGLALVGLALLSWLAFALATGADLFAARALSALRVARADGSAEGGVPGAIEGSLELSEDARVEPAGRGARARAGLDLGRRGLRPAAGPRGGGALRGWPAGGGGSASPSRAASRATVAAGVRAAGIEWPPDGRLLCGDRDAVVRGLVRRAGRRATAALALAALATAGAAAWLVVRTL